MIHVHASNGFEGLLASLFERLKQDGEAHAWHPWQGPTVLVPSLGVRRAITLALADRDGVCMGLHLDFLASWLWRTMGSVLPGVANESPFDAPALAWRVHRLLERTDLVQAHPRLAAYVASADDTMRFELAQRVATLFEQYTVYRSAWLQRWARGQAVETPTSLFEDDAHTWSQDEAWQRELWQALAREVPAAADDPIQRLIQRVAKDGRTVQSALPSALHVFAPTALPPRHLDALQAIAQVVPVHLYLFNPSREYWFDLVDERRLARWRAKADRSPALAHRLAHADAGHPLLSGWARPAQDLWATLLQRVDDAMDTLAEAWVEPARPTRLARLQRAVLDNAAANANGDFNGNQDSPDDSPRVLYDNSLEVHVSTSLRRELESLHNRLLARLSEPDAPRADQVLVVTPDLEAAAPLIDAVFGTAHGARHIAYAITGQHRSDPSGAAEALLQLLQAAPSRWRFSDLDALLQRPLIAQALGLDEDAAALVRTGLATAGMRWGLDAAHRSELDAPADDDHTLDDAIDRLLLARMLPASTVQDDDAFAVAFDEHRKVLHPPWLGKAPAHDTALAQHDALGVLMQLQSQLQPLRAMLRVPKTPEAWQQSLLDVVDTFLSARSDAQHDGVRDLRTALADWRDTAERGGQTQQRVPWPIVQLTLTQALDARAPGAVPGGSVTFASMAGLRGSSYRIVAVVGLNDGAFPRQAPQHEFDLMAAAPWPGDRQRRQDDRQTMLDLTLAAREHLWLSFTGRSQRSGEALPPSVLIDELMDAVAADEGVSSEQLRRALWVEHPLQGFAPELFHPHAPPTQRSHDEALARAALAMVNQHHGASEPNVAPNMVPAAGNTHPSMHVESNDDEQEHASDDGDDASDDEASGVQQDMAEALQGAQPFFIDRLPPCDAALRHLDLADLRDILKNPARALLKQRLGVDWPRDDQAAEDIEPFTVGHLLRWHMRDKLLHAAWQGADAVALHAWLRAHAHWPGGALGELAARDLANAMVQQVGALGATPRTEALGPRTLQSSWEGQAWTLELALDAVVVDPSSPMALVHLSASKLDGRVLLTAWIDHLALCVLRPDHASNVTRVVASDATQDLAALPPSQAESHLCTLLALAAQALHEPLPFMPRSSHEAFMRGAALSRASNPFAKKGRDGDGPKGDDADPNVQLAWRGRAPMDQDPRFVDVARTVFAPLSAVFQAPTP